MNQTIFVDSIGAATPQRGCNFPWRLDGVSPSLPQVLFIHTIQKSHEYITNINHLYVVRGIILHSDGVCHPFRVDCNHQKSCHDDGILWLGPGQTSRRGPPGTESVGPKGSQWVARSPFGGFGDGHTNFATEKYHG